MATEAVEKVETGNNTYDESPYESCPFTQTTIENLSTIAHVFGHKAPKVETARVLELGCASGGNIIPQAIKYPKAKFVGVDLSPAQTKVGNDQIKTLGLKNIEIKTASITDLEKSLGEFDYIVCHGVISWVPEFVRTGIFDACEKLLSKDGLAYISYNTLPGWNMVRSIRDMMLYHSKDFVDVEEKITQSILLLDFIKDALDGTETPYAKILKNEMELLTGQPRNYLRHDHMEENNHQYYFHEFMAEASKRGMQYLGDALLSSMYVGNLPPKASVKLQEISDIVRSEQYMDFITNRRFRSTIICKKEAELNRSIDVSLMEDFSFSAKINPEKPEKEVSLEDASELTFFHNNNKEAKLSSSSPIMKVILYILSENQFSLLSIDDLVDMASKKLTLSKLTKDQIKAEVGANMVRLLFSGYLQFSKYPYKAVDISKKPKASDYARAQLEFNNNAWVTSQNHERVNINIIDAFLIKYLDGTNDKASLLEKMKKHVNNGELSVKQNDKVIDNADKIEKDLKEFIDQSLEKYLQNKILVA
jgi:methyltransferase-like protein/cyclopropane fatty-acyl-phospholipid synthase-like methyltransferase